MRSLERYTGLVSDPMAFLDACNHPLPETVWSPTSHAAALSAFPSTGLRAMNWSLEGFRVDHRDDAFGVHFLLGGFLIQEEAAMMAVSALDPSPGEWVLDLCAAPGNKTVQLACAVGPSGWIVANDVSAARLQILRGLADRFRLPNLSLVVHDGTSFPFRSSHGSTNPILFDAVLADVPCSCEGTCRKNNRVFERMEAQRTAALPLLQERLLRRAIRLTKPGGRILYATCTFAPEENELVIQQVLEHPEPDQDVSLESIQIPGAHLDEGLTSWNGSTLSSEMRRAVRVWPHQNDTGGFFFALLRKGSSGASNRCVSAPKRPLDHASMPWGAYDLPDAFLGGHSEEVTGRKHARLVTSSRPVLPFNEIAVGFSGVNLKSREPRPSTPLAAYLAPHARAGIAEIAREDMIRFLSRESVSPLSLIPPADKTRYVLVRSGPLSIGLGHIDASGQLESLFPRHAAGLPVAEWLQGLSDA